MDPLQGLPPWSMFLMSLWVEGSQPWELLFRTRHHDVPGPGFRAGWHFASPGLSLVT